jgi:hypothetical protein
MEGSNQVSRTTFSVLFATLARKDRWRGAKLPDLGTPTAEAVAIDLRQRGLMKGIQCRITSIC